MPRSYLGPWLLTWKEWHLCCSVSWRRSFHPASSIQCNIWFCTSHMRHEWGGMQGHWCYPIERCLKVLQKKCRNKCKIEASIAEAYILEEVANFTTTYYGDNLPSVHNPPLVTMLAKMNRTSAFSKGNSKAQVHRPLSTWVLKSGVVSCYMCCRT